MNEREAVSRWKAGFNGYENFVQRYPQFETLLVQLNSWEEILATKWCMDNYEVIIAEKELPYIILPYEKLVTKGEQVLKKLFYYYGISWSERYLEGLNSKSSTVVEGSNLDEGKSPLHGWIDKLDSSQNRKILSITNKFGCSFYSSDLEPDYERLNVLSKVKL